MLPRRILMKTIEPSVITKEVKRLAIEAATYIESDVLNAIECAKNKECGLAKSILEQIIENDELASQENIPMCQDTGITIVFVEIGNEVYIPGDIYKAINDGVSLGYTEGYLRKSVVKSPLNRVNTKDNTPAIIHIKHTLGDKLKITLCPKGAGSENMSKVKMLVPADGIDGIKKFVLSTIKEAGGRPCPPLIVGVGIGGDLEKCALLAKESLLRPIEDESSDSDAKALEKELFEEINKLNVGPMGLGGKTTALAVKVNLYPCHIASLPVAVNIQCHASRHKVVEL
jgi:fumarate hydratase subunit alpha